MTSVSIPELSFVRSLRRHLQPTGRTATPKGGSGSVRGSPSSRGADPQAQCLLRILQRPNRCRAPILPFQQVAAEFPGDGRCVGTATIGVTASALETCGAVQINCSKLFILRRDMELPASEHLGGLFEKP
jgi:hypothetical protein